MSPDALCDAGECLAKQRYLGIAVLDGSMALEQILRSPHDWSVYHFSVDSERAAPARLRLGVLGDDTRGVGDLTSRRRILLVDNGNLSRMDTASAQEAGIVFVFGRFSCPTST